MKNKIIIFLSLTLFLMLIVSGCSLFGGSSKKQAESTAAPTLKTSAVVLPTTGLVNIRGSAFDPAVLKVKQGTTITWINNDSVPHQIKASPFSSDSLKKGQSFSYTFNNVGNFDYFCSIHPQMKGLIIVE